MDFCVHIFNLIIQERRDATINFNKYDTEN